MKVELGFWNALEHLALPLRIRVFVDEQGVPEDIERDEYDDIAIHAVIVAEPNYAIATGRLVRVDQSSAKIGRLAVDRKHRGQGLGRVIMRALTERARQWDVRELQLHAQCDAQAFYEREGFVVVGQRFVEANIDHVLMQRSL